MNLDPWCLVEIQRVTNASHVCHVKFVHGGLVYTFHFIYLHPLFESLVCIVYFQHSPIQVTTFQVHSCHTWLMGQTMRFRPSSFHKDFGFKTTDTVIAAAALTSCPTEKSFKSLGLSCQNGFVFFI